MNNKKQELINKVMENMDKCGVMEERSDDSDFLLGESFNASLKWLPVENLEKMAELDLSECKSFEEAYQHFGKAWALRFEPYIVPEHIHKYPTMCIRRNRFLHMFRGYHFQVSGTIDGIGECNSGAYRTDFLTSAGWSKLILKDGLISYMLWWAALIDVGFGYDNFRELFNNDISVIERFLHSSMRYCNADRCLHWRDVRKYIKLSKGNIDTANRKMYHIYDKKDGVLGYLAIGKKSVQVELANNELLTITIPSLLEGTQYDMKDEDDRDEVEEQIEILESNHYLEMIAVMALALCGIKISFINWYTYSRILEPMKAINKPGMINVESLNDIYKCEPDEF